LPGNELTAIKAYHDVQTYGLPDTSALYTVLLANPVNNVYLLIEFETPNQRNGFIPDFTTGRKPMVAHFDIFHVEKNFKPQKIAFARSISAVVWRPD
jgi:hypothetical protein